MQTFRERLAGKSNDYSHFEPFHDFQPIRTSIVIPVYGEATLLEHCLLALVRNQDVQLHAAYIEVIVVNDGGGKEVEAKIAEIAKIASDPPVGYIDCIRNYGRSVARNVGVANSQHDLILFLDSDMLVSRDFLRSHWIVHSSVDNACVAGLFEKIGQDHLDVWQTREPYPHNDFRVTRFLKEPKKQIKEREIRILEETRCFKDLGFGRTIHDWTLPLLGAGCELSARRTSIEAVGGFDIAFEGWGYEDNFFVAKLIAAGALLIPTKTANCFKVTHDPRGSSGQLRQLERVINRMRYEEMLELCVFPELFVPFDADLKV